MTIEPKAEAFGKRTFRIPLTTPDGKQHTYDIRIGWDPEKVGMEEIARCGAIEASRTALGPCAVDNSRTPEEVFPEAKAA